MKFIPTKLPDLYIIEQVEHRDERGAFSRLFCANELGEIMNNSQCLQSNFCHTEKAYTFRGLHYQIVPYSEAKIVKCVRGAIIDIAVDMRPNSTTYLQHLEIELEAEQSLMVLVPEGFAHGYLSLQDNTQVIYFTNNFYNSEAEQGLNPFDPVLNLSIVDKIRLLSDKDKNASFISVKA